MAIGLVGAHNAEGVTGEGALDLDSTMDRANVPGLRCFAEFFEPFVHEVKGDADGDGGDTDADHQGYLLLPRRGSDEESSLEILRGVAGI